MTNPKQPKINNLRSDDYRSIFVSGVFGGTQLDHINIIIQSTAPNANDTLSGNPSIDRTDEVCLIMTLTQAKTVFEWLGKHLEKYEETVDKIQSLDEMAKKIGAKKGGDVSPVSSGPTGMFG
jgi:hypothetical protein